MILLEKGVKSGARKAGNAAGPLDIAFCLGDKFPEVTLLHQSNCALTDFSQLWQHILNSGSTVTRARGLPAAH